VHGITGLVGGRASEKEAKDVFIFSPIFETVEEAVQVLRGQLSRYRKFKW